MSHVVNVFDRLGYTFKDLAMKSWDVMWAHQYPFLDMKGSLNNLEPHQKVISRMVIGFKLVGVQRVIKINSKMHLCFFFLADKPLSRHFVLCLQAYSGHSWFSLYPQSFQDS